MRKKKIFQRPGGHHSDHPLDRKHFFLRMALVRPGLVGLRRTNGGHHSSRVCGDLQPVTVD